MFAMMDNNENENYCYPQQSAKTGSASKGAIPKATAAKYQNQFNNNNNVAEQENLMPQVNGAQTGNNCVDGERTANGFDPATVSVATPEAPRAEISEARLVEKADNLSLNESYPNEESAKALDSDEGDLDADFSDNNSLGNLSYISENGLIEEIILLPNNIYSDDENGSASDDCIYAYRGDDHAPPLLEYRDQPADDETDFLEMDFDPEPSSELENLLENQVIDVNPFQTARTVDILTLREIDKGLAKSPCFEKDSSDRKEEEPPDEADGAIALVVKAPTEMKKTGAIPKKISSYSQQSSLELRDHEMPGTSKSSVKGNSKNLKLDLQICTDGADESGYRYNYPYFNHQHFINYENEENSCLDCTEKEFVMQTKQDLSVQKVCRSCHSRKVNHGGQPQSGAYFNDVGQSLNSSNSETDLMSIRAEQIVLQALNKINELKATPPSLGQSRSMDDFCTELDAEQKDQEVPLDFTQDICSENTVTIYTLNCGELTIIEALTRIGVTPNLDVLRQYFIDQYNVEASKMNIPQYLLYMSKRDCNFKKLVEAIKSCCDEPLDVQYYPLDPFSDTPEVVQINSLEIAKRWNANTNLRQIINFKHKHFHTLNVLGKIVNILRQPSRGKHTSQTINIPQYYKSGSITITRIT